MPVIDREIQDSHLAALGSRLVKRLGHYAASYTEVAAARQSFYGMVKFVGRDKRGAPLREDAYSRIIADLLVRCYGAKQHLSHVAGPGLGKSTWGRLFAMWRLAQDITTSIVAISAAESVSENNVSLCRQIVSGREYQAAFPNVVPDVRASGEADADEALMEELRGWTLGRWFVKGRGQTPDPTMEAVAAIPRSESRRVDILLADDIMTRLVAESAKMREALCDAFFATWIEGRLSNGGWACAFQNCWHADDLAHQLRGDSRFCSAWVGIAADHSRMTLRLWNPPKDGLGILEDPKQYEAEAVTPQDGAAAEFTFPLPNDPALFSPEVLREREKARPDEYRRLWRLKALSNKDKMFSAWDAMEKPPVTAAALHRCREVGGKLVFSESDLMRYAFGVGWDISGSTRKGDAIAIWSKDVTGIMSPVELHLGTFTAEEVVGLIDDAWRRGIKFSRFYIENNATQEKIVEAVRSLARHHARAFEWQPLIAGFTTGTNKVDPELGLPGLNQDFSLGLVAWPQAEARRSDVAHADTWLAYESAFSECPRFLKKSETPDSVMASWFARRALDHAWPRGASEGRPVIASVRRRHERAGLLGRF